MSDTETTRYAIVLVAAIIGLASACVSFVNSRLNEAKTAAKRKQILVTTAIVADTVLFLGGCALVGTSVFAGSGFMVLLLSFFTAVGLFIWGAIPHLRLAVANVVVRGFLVILIILSSILVPMVEIQRMAIETQKSTAEFIKGVIDTLTPAKNEEPNKAAHSNR